MTTPTIDIWEGFEMLEELELFAVYATCHWFRFRIPDGRRNGVHDEQKITKLEQKKPCNDCFNNFHNNENTPCDENATKPHCKTLENWKKASDGDGK